MRQLRFPLIPRWLRYLSALAVAGVVFYYSLLTAPPITPPTPDPFWDKKLHFAAYAGFTLALAYATAHLKDTPKRRATIVLAIAVLYGALIELSQGFLPQRYFSLADLLANVVGAALASAWFIIERRIHYVRVDPTLELE